MTKLLDFINIVYYCFFLVIKKYAQKIMKQIPKQLRPKPIRTPNLNLPTYINNV